MTVFIVGSVFGYFVSLSGLGSSEGRESRVVPLYVAVAVAVASWCLSVCGLSFWSSFRTCHCFLFEGVEGVEGSTVFTVGI